MMVAMSRTALCCLAVVLAIFLATCGGTQALLIPGNSSTGAQDSPTKLAQIDYNKPNPPLSWNDTGARYYTGVAKVAITPECSGSVLRGKPAAKAVLLTAGHCISALGNNHVHEGLPLDLGSVFFFRYIDGPKPIEVRATKVLWSSMRVFDISLVELNATNAELAAQGIRFYPLSGNVSVGDAVQTVGVPVSGLDESQWVLRRSPWVPAGPTTRLLERGWLWSNARRFNAPGMLPGASGSPLFNRFGQIVGVVSTTTIGALAGSECYLGNPCEVRSKWQGSLVNTSYAMNIRPLLPCFPKGVFDRSAPNCPLEPERWAVKMYGDTPANELPEGVQYTKRRGRISVRFQGPEGMDGLRWKLGPIGSTNCRIVSGYGPLVKGSNGTYPAAIYSDKEQRLLLCAAPVVKGATRVWSSGFEIVVVDRTPPTMEAILQANPIGINGSDGIQVTVVWMPTELFRYDWKKGKSGTLDCAVSTGYYPAVSYFVDRKDLPLDFCVKVADAGMNYRPPKLFTLKTDMTLVSG